MIETYDCMFLFDILVISLDYNIPHTFYSTSIHLILSTVLQYLTMLLLLTHSLAFDSFWRCTLKIHQKTYIVDLSQLVCVETGQMFII